MPSNFPTSLDTLTNPGPTDQMNVVSHSDQHINANDAIEAIEAKVGITNSAVATTLDYKVNRVYGLIGIDVASYATGGSGTTGAPWTGIDTNCPWASGQRFIFRPGFYSWATSPTFGIYPRIHLIGAGPETVIRCTGAGPVLDLASSLAIEATGYPEFQNVLVEGMTLDGRGTASAGVLARLCHFSAFRDLLVKNATVAMDIRGCVCNLYESIFIRGNEYDLMDETQSTVHAFVFDEYNPGTGVRQSTASAIVKCYVTGVGGKGLWLKSAFNIECVGGAFDSCGTNIQIDAASTQNRINCDFEFSTNICTIAGDRNTFSTCNAVNTDITITGQDNSFVEVRCGNVVNNGSKTTFRATAYESYTGTDLRRRVRGGNTEGIDILPPMKAIAQSADEVSLWIDHIGTATSSHAQIAFRAKNAVFGPAYMYQDAANTMGWGDGGGDMMMRVPSGKRYFFGNDDITSPALVTAPIGIGVKRIPAVPLDINGAGRIEGAFTVNNSQGANNLTVKGQTDATLLLTLASSNQVSVGTSTPPTGVKMHVEGIFSAGAIRAAAPKTFGLQQDAGQPTAAEAPVESRVNKFGISATLLTLNGTTSQCVTDDTGQYLEYTSGTSASSEAGWEFPTAAPTIPIMAIRLNPITRAVIKTGTDISQQRAYVGWFSADPMAADVTNSIHAMGFRWSVTTANNPSVTTGGTYTGVPTLTPTGHTATTAPAYTAIMGVNSVTLGAAGSGYAPGTYEDQPMTGGVGSGATFDFTVNGAGQVTSVVLVLSGRDYTSAPSPDFSAAGGTGATATTTLKVVAVVSSNGGGNNVTVAPTALTPSGGGETVAATFGAISLGGQLQCVCGNGTAQVFADPETAVAADTRLTLDINAATSGQVEFWVNGDRKATISTNLPGNTTSLAYYCNLRITSTNARSLRISSMQVNQE